MKRRFIILLIACMILLASCNVNNINNNINKPSLTICDVHVDTDDNTWCDVCGTTVIVTLDIYAINDLHGKFEDTDENPGVDELTTFLKNAKQTDELAIFLSSGDMWQGSAESNLTRGNIITEWMNELDFVSMTLGNHEFDWGEDAIIENAEIAEFPFLAINAYDRETNQRLSYVKASTMIEEGSVKIGVIGAIGDCYSSIAPDKVTDVYFKVGKELTELVKAEAKALREQGADVVVYSIHDGSGSSKGITSEANSGELSSYYNVELSDGYVDVVFEGHTHQQYVMYDKHGVYHLQNGGENKGISHVELEVNYVNNKASLNHAEFIGKGKYTSLADDPIVDTLVEKYKDEIGDVHSTLGINPSYLSSDSLCDIVANLYYKLGVEYWGDRYSVSLGGGFLQARSPYSLPAGEVTYADLQSIFPFDNDIVLCSVSGRDLCRRFIQTSNSSYHVSYAAGLASNINDNATYYIVVDSYTASYAPNNLTVVASYTPGVYARDLLADYFKNIK